MTTTRTTAAPALLVDETSRLLPRLSTLTDNEQHQGHATYLQTVLNLMKTCAGTGTLALPWAAQEGGLLLNTVGLYCIALWNCYSVHRLLRTLELYVVYEKSSPPATASTTFSKVVWFVLGPRGIHGLDLVLVVLFVGIIVAYEDAVIGFLHDTPLGGSHQKWLHALVVAIIVGCLSLVPDMGYLAKASAYGLIVLAGVFIVLAGYGIHLRLASDGNHAISFSISSLLWPQDGLQGVSHWFGCTVFGFGVVPLTYNYYESMEQPQLLGRATSVALIGVATSYIVLGTVLLFLFWDPMELLNGDILELLPLTGWLPIVVRLCMIVVVVFTAPLLLLPCGLIVEGKLHLWFGLTPTKALQSAVRLSICLLCAIISVGVPGFVYVLSFVGCACVALVGFIIPPLLRIGLAIRYQRRDLDFKELALDSAMLVWGLIATILTSTYTFKKLYSD